MSISTWKCFHLDNVLSVTIGVKKNPKCVGGKRDKMLKVPFLLSNIRLFSSIDPASLTHSTCGSALHIGGAWLLCWQRVQQAVR